MESLSVPMIRGVGIDIIEVSRVEQALARWGENFVGRLFTAAEAERARHARVRSQRLAARFAAKEACFTGVAAAAVILEG